MPSAESRLVGQRPGDRSGLSPLRRSRPRPAGRDRLKSAWRPPRPSRMTLAVTTRRKPYPPTTVMRRLERTRHRPALAQTLNTQVAGLPKEELIRELFFETTTGPSPRSLA